MSLEPTTNFKDSNGVDLGSKLVTKDYLISVYPEIGSQIGIPPELWVWGHNSDGQLGNSVTSNTANRTPITTFTGGSNWKQVSSGDYHLAAIKTDGTLWTWGSGNSGRLGNGIVVINSNISTPVTTFTGGTDWKQVSAGGNIVAAIKTDGTLWTWGENNYGALGNILLNNSSTPITTFAGGTDWKQVSVGAKSVAAIKTDGTLWTWGDNSSGELGKFTVFQVSTPVTTFAGGTNWADTGTTNPENLYNLIAGDTHAAAIKTDGTLWVWGNGTVGRLGNADTTIINSTPITTFAGGTNWKQVSAGSGNTAAIKTDGTLWTWGGGSDGILGNADITTRSTPVTTFTGGTNWKQVSSGTATAAIKTDGTLWTWGAALAGILGNRTASLSNVSTPVTTFAGGTDWKHVSVAGHALAIKTDGTLWAWGRGTNGQIGNANIAVTNSTPVTTFTGGTNWKQVSVGYTFSAAIKTDGTLWTWGRGTNGRLGNADTTDRSTPVTTFTGGTNWKQVSCGTGLFPHISAIKTDGTLWTWGNGNNGKLGTGVTTDVSTPVTTFTGGTNWKQVDCGENYTIALRDDEVNKEIFIWGLGSSGQLGNADTTDRSTPVTTFAGGTNWADTTTTELYTIDAGDGYTAAIKTDGTLWTWGLSSAIGDQGRLGNNNQLSVDTPVTTFAGGTDWRQVSAGNVATAAIKTDGTLWVWGNGDSGQTGLNFIVKMIPVTTFAGGTNWADAETINPEDLYTISSQGYRSAAIKTDGTLWTWGAVSGGALGNAVTTNTSVSTPVTTFAGGTNWKQISVGGYAFMAGIKTDGTLWTWGSGSFGILGNGVTTGSISTPVTTFAGGTNWKQISCGYRHIAATKTDGTLWTWGWSYSGRLGNNTDSFSSNGISTPVTTFAGGTNWKQVSAGQGTAATKTDGTLWIWGDASSGRLGNTFVTTVNNALTPVTTFVGGTNWKQVSVGKINSSIPLPTAAIKTDGTLWIWGNGSGGLLGNGVTTTTNVSTPITTFAGGSNWRQVNVGEVSITAVKVDGTLWTWGRNFGGGALGNASTSIAFTPVTTFVGGTNWMKVNGGYTGIALHNNGTLWTWGNGLFGTLGNASTESRSTPVTTFAGGTNWADAATINPEDLHTLSAGTIHSAAIKTDGTLWTWGSGSSGRLGNAGSITISTPITSFAGGTNWKQVCFSGAHSVAIKTDGTLWTWGLGSNGRLGNGVTTGSISTPVTTFAGGTDWKQASGGDQHTAAIKTNGTLWSWGNGISGQLGTLTLGGRITPVTTFAGGTNWADTATTNPEDLYTLSAGYRHTAAIKTDGTLWTWGAGTSGQLGNTIITGGRSTPVTTFAGGTNWKQVSVAQVHTSAIKTDGTLWIWGAGTTGRLGNANTSDRSTPVTTFTGGTDWKQISSGYGHTAAIKTDGTLWVWGNASNGRLGNGSTIGSRSTPITTFAGGTDWKTVTCTVTFGISSNANTAAIKTDGTLWIWGNGTYGRLGNGITTGNRSTPITTFAGGTDWKQVSSSASHITAIKTDGTLWTWGNGSFGQLGNAIEANRSTPVTTFAGGTDWKQASGGYRYTAAVKTDGTLWTWGDGSYGKTGTNDQTDRSTPATTFAGGTNWKQVSAGFQHTVALRDDGVNKELFVFGSNSNLQLGITDGSLTTYDYPIEVFPYATNWKQISAGYRHTAAIKTDGTLWTWGLGTNGRLGNGETSAVFGIRSTPVTTFIGGTDWKQVNTGNNHTAAVKTDGTLWTWGDGSNGRLGNGVTTGNISTPVTTFTGGTDWNQVSSGGSNTAAIKTDGTLWTWGYNGTGQLGNNTQRFSSTPVTTFVGGTNWKQVNAGNSHTLALRDDGVNKELFVFGNNIFKQLGTNNNQLLIAPEPISDETNWRQIEVGILNHSAAIKTDGTLWVWGTASSGKLGNALTSTNIPSYTPITTFAGGTNWKQVSAGSGNTAAIKTDGTLWVWGSVTYGQLGNGLTIGVRSTPITTFSGGTNWKQVSLGQRHIAAVKTDGTLWTWGSSLRGQLGNNSTNIRITTPITTFAGGTDWKQVSCGYFHTAAVKTDGTLWTWGNGSYGKCGVYIDFLKFDGFNIYTPVTTFAGGTNWKQVSAGFQHTVALRDDGVNKELFLFGSNNKGTLGINNSNLKNFIPNTTFAGGTNWKQVSAGNGFMSAIKTNGTLWTWGYNGRSELGINGITSRSTPITTFAGGTNWKQTSTGMDSVAAIKTDGTLWTWGNPKQGKLANSLNFPERITPVTTFAGGTNWANTATTNPEDLYTIAVSGDFAVESFNHVSMAIKNDGTLWVWGTGKYGALGTNSSDKIIEITPVTTFAGGTNWKQISAGERTCAAIKTDGTLWTWGYNATFTSLGNFNTDLDKFAGHRYTPITTFAGGTNWKQVSCGYVHAAAIKTDGTLWTWGYNDDGALGIGTLDINLLTPITTFAGGTDWKQVSCGYDNTAAIKTDGTLWTWGANFRGQIGNNNSVLASISTPTTTFAGGTDWKQIDCGTDFMAAIKTDGTLWTWGQGRDGQLGDNNAIFSNIKITPITTFAGGTNWKQVSAGGLHSAAIKTDGTLWTWGFGAMGNNESFGYSATPITTFAGGNDWIQVNTGYSVTLALKGDGINNQLFVFGTNDKFELGILDSSYVPNTTFAGGTDWKQVSTGEDHAVAIKTDGTLWTWGNGGAGQLGNFEVSNRSTPVTTFAGGTNWKQASAGGVVGHTGAIRSVDF
jgi:alpha-tubulin suppressor-like RCC1 family protein